MTTLQRYDKQAIDTLARHKDAIWQLEPQLKRNILEIGQHLAEVRDLLRHNKQGGFERWVEEELGWSRRTAFNFLKVYEVFGNRANVAQLSLSPSSLYLLAGDSTPPEAREAILQRAEQGEQLSFKAIEQAVQSYKLSHPRIGTSRSRLRSSKTTTRSAPDILCLFCQQSNLPIYPIGTTRTGICLRCARTALRILEGTNYEKKAQTPA